MIAQNENTGLEHKQFTPCSDAIDSQARTKLINECIVLGAGWSILGLVIGSRNYNTDKWRPGVLSTGIYLSSEPRTPRCRKARQVARGDPFLERDDGALGAEGN